MGAENFAAQERLMQQLDRESSERLRRVERMMHDSGRPDLADELNEKIQLVENGVQGARSTWHSISDAQRRALILLSNGSASLHRVDGGSYAVVSGAGSRATGIRVGTVRNLARRELLEWTGGAFDPEASAALTERAAFVLRHGRPEPGTHFEGFRP